MTQIPDPTRSDEDRRRQTPYFRIPAEPVRQPLFANLTNVNFMQGSLYLDFAYIDPYQLGNPHNELAPNGRPIIDATPVVRLVLTPETLLPLYLRLQDVLKELDKLPNIGKQEEVDKELPQ